MPAWSTQCAIAPPALLVFVMFLRGDSEKFCRPVRRCVDVRAVASATRCLACSRVRPFSESIPASVAGGSSASTRVAGFCSTQTEQYRTTDTVSGCFPASGGGNTTLVEAFDIVQNGGTCILSIAFTATGAGFREGLTKMYTSLTPDCKVRRPRCQPAAG